MTIYSVNIFNNTSKTVDNPLETSAARCSLKTMRYAPPPTQRDKLKKVPLRNYVNQCRCLIPIKLFF